MVDILLCPFNRFLCTLPSILDLITTSNGIAPINTRKSWMVSSPLLSPHCPPRHQSTIQFIVIDRVRGFLLHKRIAFKMQIWFLGSVWYSKNAAAVVIPRSVVVPPRNSPIPVPDYQNNILIAVVLLEHRNNIINHHICKYGKSQLYIILIMLLILVNTRPMHSAPYQCTRHGHS